MLLRHDPSVVFPFCGNLRDRLDGRVDNRSVILLFSRRPPCRPPRCTTSGVIAGARAWLGTRLLASGAGFQHCRGLWSRLGFSCCRYSFFAEIFAEDVDELLGAISGVQQIVDEGPLLLLICSLVVLQHDERFASSPRGATEMAYMLMAGSFISQALAMTGNTLLRLLTCASTPMMMVLSPPTYPILSRSLPHSNRRSEQGIGDIFPVIVSSKIFLAAHSGSRLAAKATYLAEFQVFPHILMVPDQTTLTIAFLSSKNTNFGSLPKKTLHQPERRHAHSSHCNIGSDDFSLKGGMAHTCLLLRASGQRKSCIGTL